MRTPTGAMIFCLILLLMDSYVFQAVAFVSTGSTLETRIIIYSLYWLISLTAIFGFLLFVFTKPDFLPQRVRTYLFATIMGLFLANFVAIIFFLIDDGRRAVEWVAIKLFSESKAGKALVENGIHRSEILSWMGLGLGGGLFISLVYGFGNKYNYQLKRVSLTYKNLPKAFDGLKLIHFSDVHSGSFTNKAAVEKGIEKMLEENADLIIFSGDLVNDKASEMTNYMDVFSRLKAPMGVYSTLGNHDYGDYVHWPQNGVTREQNLETLKKIHGTLGWKLMMNEHVTFKRGEDEIALIGIENWSAKSRFPKHGDMARAYAGTEKYPFKILISHDPSHWDAQVITDYPDVDLTLSGHTHGMQFGIEIPGFRWSPVQYVYKNWAGLYANGNQKLYVNRGFGFIGYPGRVGVLPEITVIELKAA
jgi:uncharacterized protein